VSERDLVSIEAEHGTIGALMIRPSLCEEVGAFLSASDFSDEDNSLAYTTVLACHSKGIKPDPISMAEICPQVPSGNSMIYVAGMIATSLQL
jgi:replicative DNA helicase